MQKSCNNMQSVYNSFIYSIYNILEQTGESPISYICEIIFLSDGNFTSQYENFFIVGLIIDISAFY